ncbi:uncharacterized protein LOC143231499 [Tachypleus tridentatus]|uniref:uncharacterized protein LOC143231499 n=1 Tax=Tachypleus tridentatus TaxID=6853 RepID=UPI003FCF2A06
MVGWKLSLNLSVLNFVLLIHASSLSNLFYGIEKELKSLPLEDKVEKQDLRQRSLAIQGDVENLKLILASSTAEDVKKMALFWDTPVMKQIDETVKNLSAGAQDLIKKFLEAWNIFMTGVSGPSSVSTTMVPTEAT